MDGSARFERSRRLGDGVECGHRSVPDESAASRGVQQAADRALELPAHQRAGGQRRSVVLRAQHRSPAAGADFRPRRRHRSGAAGHRPQCDLRRRVVVVVAMDAVAGREAAGVRPRRRRRRLEHHPRPRRGVRQGPGRRSQMDALLQHLVDERQQGVLLLALPRAAEEQSPRSRAVWPGPLLPPHRHAAVAGHVDLRAQGFALVDHQRRRHGGRPLSDGRHVRRRGKQESPVLRRPRTRDPAEHRRAGQAGDGGQRRRVLADRQPRFDGVSALGQGRAQPRDPRRRPGQSGARCLEDHHSGAQGSDRKRRGHRRPHRRAVPRRRAEPAAALRPERRAAGRGRGAGSGNGRHDQRTSGCAGDLVQLQLAADALDGIRLQPGNAEKRRLRSGAATRRHRASSKRRRCSPRRRTARASRSS